MALTDDEFRDALDKSATERNVLKGRLDAVAVEIDTLLGDVEDPGEKAKLLVAKAEALVALASLHTK